MEEDAKQFLLRVVRSLTAALLWLIINMTLGIYIGLLLFDDVPSTGNIIFYIWFVFSIGFSDPLPDKNLVAEEQIEPG